jgi:hypothetical protein
VAEVEVLDKVLEDFPSEVDAEYEKQISAQRFSLFRFATVLDQLSIMKTTTFSGLNSLLP